MKNTRTQAGKGLSGFIIGLLLATAVIAGILFFLNKNKTPFKQPEIQTQTPPPEILTPGGQQAGTPPATPASDTDVLGSFIASQTDAASEPATASTPATPPASHKPPQTLPQAKPPQPKPEKPAKVSPEQILNSGSVEKARAAAKQEAAKKPTDNTADKAAVLLQLGSFKDNSAADVQRAKLAMLGVDARVVKGSANGQTVYRVQTGALSQQQAEKMAAHLRQNQIDSLMRTAPQP